MIGALGHAFRAWGRSIDKMGKALQGSTGYVETRKLETGISPLPRTHTEDDARPTLAFPLSLVSSSADTTSPLLVGDINRFFEQGDSARFVFLLGEGG